MHNIIDPDPLINIVLCATPTLFLTNVNANTRCQQDLRAKAQCFVYNFSNTQFRPTANYMQAATSYNFSCPFKIVVLAMSLFDR